MTRLWRKPLFIAIIAASIGFFITYPLWLTDDPYSSKNRNDLYQALIERSGILNRDLPKLLDMNTRFERAEVVDYGMRYVYSLVNVDRYQHDIAQIQAQVEPALSDYYCRLDAMKFYRKQADHFTVRYLDRHGSTLFELRLTPTHCNSFR